MKILKVLFRILYRLQHLFSPDQDSGLGITPLGKGA